jgi:hypothetical protein
VLEDDVRDSLRTGRAYIIGVLLEDLVATAGGRVARKLAGNL